ncbi:MAG: hypothetical protein Q9M28_11070 [Mariprofundaceae bacterium]|nr:hypothetical protein [Mariprofundaceae bacterium]
MIQQNMRSIKKLSAELLKEAIWSCCKVQPKTTTHSLFSSRRSGSTMLMEAIASNYEILPMGQPFASYSASSMQLKQMLAFLQPHGHIIYPDQEASKHMLHYFDLLLKGELIVGAPWRCWHHSFRRSSSRVALKILAAKAVMEKLASHSGGSVVYSTRHPIPQSLSLMRNHWGLTVQAYLGNIKFIERELSQKQYDLCMDIVKNTSLLRKYVLNWVLENLMAIRAMSKHPEWLYLDYERCVLYPEESLQKLQQHLQLHDFEKMLAAIQKPSRSTRNASTSVTREKIATSDQAYLVNRWRKDISLDDELKAMQILEVFEIDLYRYGEDLPICNV